MKAKERVKTLMGNKTENAEISAVKIDKQWEALKKQAEEISSCLKGNIIVIAYFPESGKPSDEIFNCITSYGDVAVKYQQKDLVQLVANEFVKKCAKQEKVSQLEKASLVVFQPPVPPLNSLVEVAEQEIDKNDINNKDSDTWPVESSGETGEIHMDIVIAERLSSPTTYIDYQPTKISPPQKSKSRIVVSSNSNHPIIKTYGASRKSAGGAKLIQSQNLKFNQPADSFFVQHGHTYALHDESSIPVVSIKEQDISPASCEESETVTIQDQCINESVMTILPIKDSEEQDFSTSGFQTSTRNTVPQDCAEVTISNVLNQAIEGLKTDSFAESINVIVTLPAAHQGVVGIPTSIDGGASSSSGDDGRTSNTTKKRGRPRAKDVNSDGTVVLVPSNRSDRTNYRFKCDRCDRAFRDSHDLKVHLRVHTGEKPFRCDQCSQRFSLKCTLKTHLLLHSGERPFQCTLCDKGFTRSDYLARHQSFHTGEKPFACPLQSCGKSFALKGRLNKHQRVLNHYAVD